MQHHHQGANHQHKADTIAKHDTSGSAQDFMRRFIIVTILLVPLVLLMEPVTSRLGIEDVPARAYLQFAIATVIFSFARIFFVHAKHEFASRQFGMMTLVSIAVGSGYLFSAASTFLPSLDAEFYLEISTLIWVLLFGHFLEARSSAGAGDALKEVAKLLPKQAHKRDGDTFIDTDIEDLQAGDIVLIKPGEKVPADGVIIKGTTHLNESLITGESKPIEKNKHDRAIAGSINIDGAIEVQLDKVGKHSTVGQIKQLIATAGATKPRSQKIADRASRILTIAAVATALATLAIWTLIIGNTFVFALTLAITVLVIACPHALGLAIPTVTTIATQLAVKHGLFIKNLEKIETIKKVDYVILDKTGTLTKGQPEVTEMKIYNHSELQKEDILGIIKQVEEQSEHPLARAVVEHINKQSHRQDITISSFKAEKGKGVRATAQNQQIIIGNQTFLTEHNITLTSQQQEDARALQEQAKTVIHVAFGSTYIASFAIADAIRDTAQATIQRIHNLGISTVMLTGDNMQTATAIASQLGIKEVFAEVLPEDKYEYVKKIQRRGGIVMMVGDGVNDAPALAGADVGVAIGAGTDVAAESADVVLTKSDPNDIPTLIVLSRLVYKKMVQNLVWALGYNIITIPAAAGAFAAFGFFLRPEIGAFLMSLSSVIVVINAMSLKKATVTK
jgi:P-type Cu2+ transporter